MSAFIFPCFLTKDTGYLLFNSNTTVFQTKETKETFNTKTLGLKKKTVDRQHSSRNLAKTSTQYIRTSLA